MTGFKLNSSPHTRRKNKTATVMKNVMIACLPGIVAQTWYFGYGTLIQISLCILAALATEAVCLKMRSRPIKQGLQDNSAILTAVLLGICLPPTAPWWIAIIGTLFAIAFAKHAYGGLGQNIFNPAMVAYVILLISFPVSMTNWLPPSSLIQYDINFYDTFLAIMTGYTNHGYSIIQLRNDLDGMTMATPLDTIKTALSSGYTYTEALGSQVFDDAWAVGWCQVNIAYLVGGFLLLAKKIVKWHIPVAFLSTLAFLSLFGHLLSPDGTSSMALHLFSASTMFAAFFILTDPVTAATSNKGRLIYAALIAIWVYIIRTWGGYPDAVAFAVMLANMCVPLIDYYTKPRVYGYKEAK